MPFIARAVVALVLLAVAAFCVFGFLATFEPIDPEAQLIWRAVYGGVGLGCVAGAVWLILAHKAQPRDGHSKA